MGAARLPPDGISVPKLAAIMGVRHTTVYDAIRRGRGPQLTPVVPGPWSKYQPTKTTNVYVTLDDAIEWLQARDPTRWADAIRHLKIEKILAQVRNARPRPQPEPPTREDRYREQRNRRELERQGHGLPLASFAAGGRA
jgi:hypothetical protein